ncbi:MAG: hypothetical protein V7775_11235 [Sulfitobacter sp.]
MIDMPAEVDEDTGIFENLHGFKNSAAFVEEIRNQSGMHYGHAGIDFIQQFVSEQPAHVAFCNAEIKRFLAAVTEEDDDPQTARRAKRFALIAASGSLAEKMGILPFPVGTCLDGVKECFRRWQVDQMSKSSKEEVDIIERAKRFISKNSDTRFDRIVRGNSWSVAPGIEQEQVEILNLPKFERAGYFKEDDDGTRTYMILPQVFETEVCGSLNASSAGRILLKHGYLIPGEGTRMARNVHVPNLAGSMRMYVIKSSILSADD